MPEEVATPSHKVPAAEKSSGDSLRKTVMPNVTRVVNQPGAFSSGPKGALPTGRGVGLPPSVILAIEPAVERTISLDLADILGRIPRQYLKEGEKPQAGRRVLLKASAVEKGMAIGKPSITLALIYEQLPEIFANEVAPSDPAEIDLPFDKVMEQFTSARVRDDQQSAPSVPQVETPFLKATMEDSERFGIKMEPVETAELPPISTEPPTDAQPATARSISNAEPEPVVRDVSKPRPSRSTIPLTQAIAPAPTQEPIAPPAPKTASPAKIPFSLPPNGTGAPASERVPASSGPPVPPPAAPAKIEAPVLQAPATPITPAPTTPPVKAHAPRPAFKTTPPSDDLKPKLTLVPGVAKPPPNSLTEGHMRPLEPMVSIPLRLTLQNVPPFQVEGNVSDIPAEARVELPLSLIQPQLANGRVSIAPKTFREALPEDYRKFFVVDEAETAVLLPLQEVLKNLPDGTLQMRGDQEQTAIGETIETPFSIKAKEDAERFSNEPKPTEPEPKAETVDRTDVKPAEPPASKSKEPTKIDAAEPVASKSKEPPKVDAKEFVTRAAALPGVAGCAVSFSDGLIMAQKLPPDVTIEGLCAAAPALRQRIEQHTRQSMLGELKSLTLQGDKSAITFFIEENICLTALHAGSELSSKTRTKLAEMAEQLTKTYAQPEKSNVDH